MFSTVSTTSTMESTTAPTTFATLPTTVSTDFLTPQQLHQQTLQQ